MTNSNIVSLNSPATDRLTELLSLDARKLLAMAIEVEVEAHAKLYSDLEVDGKKAVVRNSYLPERNSQNGLGEIPGKVPKTRDRSGSGIQFTNQLIPPYLKPTNMVEGFIP